MSLEFPDGPVPLNSPFYVQRSPCEELAYCEILKSGSLTRIQSPRQMGKSSLLFRVLNQADHQGYHTVYLDFQRADEAIFSSLTQFLRWLCANVSQQLNWAFKR